jgi:hypothetical protein
MIYWHQQAHTTRRQQAVPASSAKEIPLFTGFHWWDMLPCVFVLVPIIVIGFLWMRRDADLRGQPGMLWALLTIPLSWVAVLVYLVVRALTAPNAAR